MPFGALRLRDKGWRRRRRCLKTWLRHLPDDELYLKSAHQLNAVVMSLSSPCSWPLEGHSHFSSIPNIEATLKLPHLPFHPASSLCALSLLRLIALIWVVETDVLVPARRSTIPSGISIDVLPSRRAHARSERAAAEDSWDAHPAAAQMPPTGGNGGGASLLLGERGVVTRRSVCPAFLQIFILHVKLFICS